MKFGYWAVGFLALAVVWLGWQVVNLAIENDGLKQVAAGHRQSIQALLSVARIASRCDLTPKDLADSLGGSVIESASDPDRTEVAISAFKAQFTGGELNELEIVGVGKVSVCQLK